MRMYNKSSERSELLTGPIRLGQFHHCECTIPRLTTPIASLWSPSLAGMNGVGNHQYRLHPNTAAIGDDLILPPKLTVVCAIAYDLGHRFLNKHVSSPSPLPHPSPTGTMLVSSPSSRRRLTHCQEAHEASDVVVGTCSINTKPALLLFHSRTFRPSSPGVLLPSIVCIFPLWAPFWLYKPPPRKWKSQLHVEIWPSRSTKSSS
jgi:hypothetical protein